MEENKATIYERSKAKMNATGAPLEAVSLLAGNYLGLGSMCNLVADEWCEILGLDGSQIVYEAAKSVMLERFDPEAIDKKYMVDGHPPTWLAGMIEDHRWRATIYELSERYPRSLFLNAAIQHISQAGYQSEITSATTASKYFNIFNNVVLDSFKRLRNANESNFQARFEPLAKICAQNEHTYFAAQAVIRDLLKDDPIGNYPLKRVSNELEKAASRRHNKPPLLGNMNLLLAGLPLFNSDVSTAILSIKQKGELSPGHVVALYKAYSGPSPPPIEYLQDMTVIDFLLNSVYYPPPDTGRATVSGAGLRPEIKDKYIWLLSRIVSTTSNPLDSSSSPSTADQTPDHTYARLVDLEKRLPVQPNATDFAQVSGTVIEQFLDLPILAAAVVVWVRYVLHDENHYYYGTYFRLAETPVPHLLLEEIAYRHPVLHARVFQAYREVFSAKINTLGPALMTALQKSIVDQMLNLMTFGYCLPILQFIKRVQRKIDESLTVHFVRRVLEMIEAPYSAAVISALAEITEPVAKTVVDMSEHHLTLLNF
ncbi:hypothetical protein IWQ60_010656, partial [Tieghemiomyces parasiticus]